MRIALFTEVFLPKIDGVVTRIVRTVDELAKLDHQVMIVAPGSPPTSYADFPVVRAPSFSLRPWYPEIKVGLPHPELTKRLLAFQPDIVHAVNPVCLGAFGVFLAKRQDLALLDSYHTQLSSYASELHLSALSGLAGKWTAFLHNQADINLCTSPQMVIAADKAGMANVDLWPKAVDTQFFNPAKYSWEMRCRLTDQHPDSPLLIYVGRLSHEKSVDDLLPIMEQLPDARLALVGSGPARAHLERALGRTRCVFVGYLEGEELAAAYASADMLVFPSATETLGFAGLEAMASGIPVIGANAGGIPHLMSNGIQGFLVAPHDTSGYVSRIRLLLDCPQQRTQMGRAARLEAERCGWSAATSALVDFYHTALHLHRNGHQAE